MVSEEPGGLHTDIITGCTFRPRRERRAHDRTHASLTRPRRPAARPRVADEAGPSGAGREARPREAGARRRHFSRPRRERRAHDRTHASLTRPRRPAARPRVADEAGPSGTGPGARPREAGARRPRSPRRGARRGDARVVGVLAADDGGQRRRAGARRPRGVPVRGGPRAGPRVAAVPAQDPGVDHPRRARAGRGPGLRLLRVHPSGKRLPAGRRRHRELGRRVRPRVRAARFARGGSTCAPATTACAASS